MPISRPIIGFIYEHPEWHVPLFEACTKEGISFLQIDLKVGAYEIGNLPKADIYYNLVSPSAYVRGNQKAINYALAVCRELESRGEKVLNGSRSMMIEFSKSAQMSLLHNLGIDYPKTLIFNDLNALEKKICSLSLPWLLKPEQGGSGARMYKVNAIKELRQLLSDKPELWLPDNLLLLQELHDYDKDFGIVRLEFVGGKLLYAMRVVTHGAFNLCPSVVCNPEDGNGHCEIRVERKPDFYAYQAVPEEAIEAGKKIMNAAGHDIGSVEYLENTEGKRIFYDINANSNLRASIAEKFRKQPFKEVISHLLIKASHRTEIFG